MFEKMIIKRFWAVILTLTMIVSMLFAHSVRVEAADNQIVNLSDGQTYSVSNFNAPSGCETLVMIESPGTYTIKGSNSSLTTGRIIVNANCTLVLDNMKNMRNKTLKEDGGVVYQGGTKGVIEIADNVTVNLVLQGENRILCDSDSTYLYGAILLGYGANLNVYGSGYLYSNSGIGRKLSQKNQTDPEAKITMHSGSIDVYQVGNQTKNKSAFEESKGNILFEYKGGSFYCLWDDVCTESYDFFTCVQVKGDKYRIRIPAYKNTYIRRGNEGEFSQALAVVDVIEYDLDEYVYAWVDQEDFEQNSPLIYELIVNDEYHIYQATYEIYEILVDAEKVDASNTATVSGTINDPSNLISNKKDYPLVFADKNHVLPDIKTQINEDGSYSVSLPIGSYETRIDKSWCTYRLNDIEISETKPYAIDLTVVADLPDTIDVYTEDDLNWIAGLTGQLSGKTINIMADIALSNDFQEIPLKGAGATDNIIVNGNNHTISNLMRPLFNSNHPSKYFSGTVQNLHLKGKSNANTNCAFASYAQSININDCSFTGFLTGGSAGGFISTVTGGNVSIKNCLVNARIDSGSTGFGGLIGNAQSFNTLDIENCGVYVSSIDGENNSNGGFIGKSGSQNNITVKNSYVFVESSNCNFYPICGLNGSDEPYSSNVVNNVYYNNSVNFITTGSFNGLASEIDDALMKAPSGQSGALINLLNANVTENNGYKTWYVNDSVPNFDIYVEPEFTVTIEGGAFVGTTESSKSFAKNTEVIVKASYDTTQKIFKGWEVTPDTVVLTEDEENETASFTMPDTQVTIRAILEDIPIESNPCTHSFTNYVSNNDATCQANGTETAECDNGCGETDTREIPNSTVAHTPDRTAPTETEPVKCFVCGYVITPATGHIHNGVPVPEVLATAEDTGTKAHYKCNGCDKLFSDEACTNEVTAESLVIQKLAPTLVSGDNGKFTKDSSTGLSFKSSAALVDLISVSVDGTVIAKANYTEASGSTIITLKPEYLNTLSVGEHTLTITSNTGSVDAKFTVEAKATTDSDDDDPATPGDDTPGTPSDDTPGTPDDKNPNIGVLADTTSPQTGDNSNIFLWVALMFAAGIGVVTTIVLAKKKRYNR